MWMPVKTIAASAAVGALGVVTGLALGSGHSPAAVDPRAKQQVEVRTQVTHRTIHVYRHAKPRRIAAGSARGGGASLPPSPAPATRASGAAGAPPSAERAAPVTRASGSRPAAGHSVPVRTQASGAGGSGPAQVKTRASGHGDDGSSHDD
jgi:hypothetical protein